MKQLYITRDITIPEDVEVTIDGYKVTIKGKKGTLVKDFSNFDAEIIKENNVLTIKAYFINKKKKSTVLSVVGYLNNMSKGGSKGYTYKSKIIFSHFPLTVEPDNKKK